MPFVSHCHDIFAPSGPKIGFQIIKGMQLVGLRGEIVEEDCGIRKGVNISLMDELELLRNDGSKCFKNVE
jgi:hypothetical protein